MATILICLRLIMSYYHQKSDLLDQHFPWGVIPFYHLAPEGGTRDIRLHIFDYCDKYCEI